MFLKRFILLSVFNFLIFFAKSQTGINFQGVARSGNNTILASQQISLRLSILQCSINGVAEYVEVRKVNTNTQGLFTIVIGDNDATSTVGNFLNINWKNTPKFLKIEMDAAAGNNFINIGTTEFQYVAYAQFAKSVDAENIIGVIPVEKGGTGTTSITALKSALAIDKATIGLTNVDNTSDTSKPISNATKAALDLKLDISDTLKYAKLKYIDSSLITKLNISDTATMLNNRIGKDTLNLSARIDLKASISDLNLKATISSPIFTGTVKGITKSMIGLDSVDNTADIDKPISFATLALINTKVSSETFSSSISTKESLTNKSSSSDLGGLNPSDFLYPTQKAVKTYIDANNSSGGISDGSITNIKIANAAVSLQKIEIIPANTILGNSTSTSAIVQTIPTTGTNYVVLSNNPTIYNPSLITPNIGDAIANSINNVSINSINGTSSITVRGNVSLRGNNSGDDAPNQRYDNLINDVVSLTSDQPISGKKTFFNDIKLGDKAGLAGTASPTIIEFPNGSQVGDVQNINENNPDINGSIDLYAPDGAKWVQLNYANRNYITLSNDYVGIWISDKEWKFDEDGIITLPDDVITGGDIYFSNNGITNIPNASIESNGPYLKIKSRLYTPEEEEDEHYGIELNYADKTKLKIDDIGLNFWTDSNDDGISSYFEIDNKNFIFYTRDALSNLLLWKFDGETAKTTLPGNLEVDGDLKLGEVIYTKEGGISGDILTYDGNGHAVWQAPNGSASLNFDLPLLNLNNSISMPAASVSVNGYLSSADFNTFNNKQDALINPLTGTGTSGQLSFFNGTNSVTSSSNLFWDDNNNRLGIRKSNPTYPFEIYQGSDNYGFMLSAPNGNTWGSTIGFQSNIGTGTITNSGLFQLDGDGAMVFRTYQNQMYFDDFDVNGVIKFRIGSENGTKKGMSFNKDGNFNVDGTISSAGNQLTSDVRLKKNIFPINNALSVINLLNPVSYQKKQKIESSEYTINENGFIAQELKKVLPQLVHESADKDKLLSVNYTAIIPILTKGIQEQQLEIEILKRELQELKKLIQSRNKRK
jgi:hypothetical protein